MLHAVNVVCYAPCIDEKPDAKKKQKKNRNSQPRLPLPILVCISERKGKKKKRNKNLFYERNPYTMISGSAFEANFPYTYAQPDDRKDNTRTSKRKRKKKKKKTEAGRGEQQIKN